MQICLHNRGNNRTSWGEGRRADADEGVTGGPEAEPARGSWGDGTAAGTRAGREDSKLQRRVWIQTTKMKPDGGRERSREHGEHQPRRRARLRVVVRREGSEARVPHGCSGGYSRTESGEMGQLRVWERVGRGPPPSEGGAGIGREAGLAGIDRWQGRAGVEKRKQSELTERSEDGG